MKKINKKSIGLILVGLLWILTANAQVASFNIENPCQGSTSYFNNTSLYSGGITSYEWDFGDGSTSNLENPEHIYQLDGIYEVVLSIFNNSNFLDQEVKIIEIYARPNAGFTVNHVCLGDENIINISSESDVEIQNYYWDFGDGQGDVVDQPKHIYNKPGQYLINLTVETSEGCRSQASNFISILPKPFAKIEFDKDEICEGEYVKLKVNTPNNDVLWSTGQTYKSIQVSPEVGETDIIVAIYEIYYQENEVCSNNDTISILVHPKPQPEISALSYPENEILPDNTVVDGNSISLNLNNVNIVSSVWSPIDYLIDRYTSPAISKPSKDISYEVEVTDQYGCKNSAEIDIKVIVTKLRSNNLVTPNADVINDTWEIYNYEYFTEYEVFIYNRWGEEVFYLESHYQNQWDGIFEENELPEGTYYYLLKSDNTDKIYKGPISLLRTPNN
ncbi:MAG: T9SS type B sorting domain-containing protein [Bacteroidetes bacterium]|jgi:gliding motility-associated-like protein|nr:T9SS type B sorting domain-containing protein [Bacteroidota bacterium]MBT6685266.1 T9SS type B sorting domain-containing protein [Bacteroidota bacterium]MBT7144029.1 T9SS type B sorting domain-containing protein [Bacteroidota bacterium]MBT7491842.1 T9SS type B sorting domain-containing protein [Bacteroidota bacterium]